MTSSPTPSPTRRPRTECLSRPRRGGVYSFSLAPPGWGLVMDIDDRGWPTWICVGLLVALLAVIILTAVCDVEADHVVDVNRMGSCALLSHCHFTT